MGEVSRDWLGPLGEWRMLAVEMDWLVPFKVKKTDGLVTRRRRESSPSMSRDNHRSKMVVVHPRAAFRQQLNGSSTT